jgi:hypothetical protein
MFIGPMMPQLKPEEIARQKAQKFEEDLANATIEEIVTSIPPDWTKHGALKV